jgi:hypothetical protein
LSARAVYGSASLRLLIDMLPPDEFWSFDNDEAYP